MNSTRSSATLSSTRFLTTRAQFSPLGRRTGSRAASASRGTAPVSVPRTITLRTSTPTLSAAEAQTFPTFWSSGALDRLQPEVTRYHE